MASTSGTVRPRCRARTGPPPAPPSPGGATDCRRDFAQRLTTGRARRTARARAATRPFAAARAAGAGARLGSSNGTSAGTPRGRPALVDDEDVGVAQARPLEDVLQRSVRQLEDETVGVIRDPRLARHHDRPRVILPARGAHRPQRHPSTPQPITCLAMLGRVVDAARPVARRSRGSPSTENRDERVRDPTRAHRVGRLEARL